MVMRQEGEGVHDLPVVSDAEDWAIGSKEREDAVVEPASHAESPPIARKGAAWDEDGIQREKW